MSDVKVIGAGLAGCEAAWQLAQRGIPVRLYEMKPDVYSPAHKSPDFAELVCSNSLRGDSLANAVGLLKEELRRMGSLILACADETRVEAGGALAVDRHGFSALVTSRIRTHPCIDVIPGQVAEIPDDGPVIIATGPLTAGKLAQDISRFLGGAQYLSFFDAAAPLVAFDSIDMQNAFFASRYGKGTADYVNCPMEKDEYERFVSELAGAQEAKLHGFEDARVFEGCMPVEVMARRGVDTLRHGPLKPVGIRHPETDKGYYAVVQLRRDNREGTVYNIVGFQTHLTFGEQKRVFSMIPALKNAEFLRYGVMHRNTYIDSPRLLNCFYQCISCPRVFFAGQMTGVEGYVESTASGFVAGLSLARTLRGQELLKFPKLTATGALASYISDPSVGSFQPMNINFGIIPPLDERIRAKQERYAAISARALDCLGSMLEDIRQ